MSGSGKMYTKYGKTCRSKKSSKSSPESEKSIKDKSEKAGEDDPMSEDVDENMRKDTGSAAKVERRKSSVLGKGSASGAHADSDDEEEDDGEPYRKGSSRARDPDAEAEEPLDAGAESDDEGDSAEAEGAVHGSDEKFAEHDGDDEGGETAATGGDDEEGGGAVAAGEDGDESGEDADQDQDESEEMAEDDQTVAEEASADEKKRRKSKGVLEYEIRDMYPEINILIQKKKREWDFQDPDIIRAIWLETKTQALSDWKVRNAKIKIDKPSFEVRETMTVTLRQEHLKNKAELQQALEERDFEMTETSRDPPHFDSIQLATNLTTDMRYKYNRNNPPVPSHYIEHFEKFKKPPFKNHPIWYIHS